MFDDDAAFAQKYSGSSDSGSSNNNDDDYDDNKKDKDSKKEEQGNSDREQKVERSDSDKKEKDDNKREEKPQENPTSENQDEEIREQDDNNNNFDEDNNNNDDNDKEQDKSEEKRAKLESDKKKLEEKLAEKAREFEQKLEKLKEKFQQKIDANERRTSDLSIQPSFSMSSASSSAMTASESKDAKGYDKKSEKIWEKLAAKSEKLDSRTLKILEKINDGKYMGDKISSTKTSDNYKLEFDSVTASGIGDKTLTSMLTGNMIFTTFDVGKSDNVKLELEECEISVDDIPYNCGFGKARTVSSGESGEKDSLVIIAFLEDDLVEELHAPLKIFLNSDIPISQIEAENPQQVSILGPQSKISHMWFLDGTATLSKFESVSDVLILENDGEDSAEESSSELSDTEQEEQEESADNQYRESDEN